MKILTTLILLIAFPVISFSQDREDMQYEAALYKINKGETASTSDIEMVDVQMDQATFRRIKHNLLNKEGIFKVELIDEGKTVRIYHFDFIDLSTIKELVLPLSFNVNFKSAQTFLIH